MSAIPSDGLSVNDKGVQVISELGVEFLRNNILSEKQLKQTAKPSDRVANRITETLIAVLQKELDVKNKQILELTSALENTTASLKASQALHAGTMQKRLIDGGADQLQRDEQTHKKKRGWFGRNTK